MNIKKLVGITLACSAIALSAAPAQAGLWLSLDNGVSSVLIGDNGAGDALTSLNEINYANSNFGGWSVTAQVYSDAPDGTGAFDLGGTEKTKVMATGQGTLTISTWTGDEWGNLTGDFTNPTSGNQTFSLVLSTTNPAGTVKSEGFLDNGLMATIGPVSGTVTGDIARAPVTIGGPFDLKHTVTITHSTLGTTSFDAGISVPEPATLALLGLGLLGLGFARRRFVA